MKKSNKEQVKSFKIIGRDPKKRKLELSFEQRAQSKKLRQIDKEKIEVAKKKLDAKKIRRITVDSVYDSNHYRILVAEFKSGVPIEEILHTKSWKTEYSILVDGEEVILEKEDALFEEIPLDKREIDEGRVFLFIDGYKTEITEHAKDDAKEQYKKVLAKRRKKKDAN